MQEPGSPSLKDTMVAGGKAELGFRTPATSLDTTTETAREDYHAWNMRRRRARAYQRIKSGMAVGGNIKFITLTTSWAAWDAGKDIRQSFRAFIMRLRRRSLCTGYVKVIEFTKAGLPHLHILLRGPYIPQWWLSKIWGEIHLSPIVDVRAVRGRDGAAGYLAKYMGKDKRSRQSWSWDWVWRGFVQDWKNLLRVTRPAMFTLTNVIQAWENLLAHYGRTGENLVRQWAGV